MNQDEIQDKEFKRLVTGYRNSIDESKVSLTDHLRNFGDYYQNNKEKLGDKYNIAMCFICLNQPYWQYASEVISGAREYFAPGHQTDFFLWSDMPTETTYGATVFPTESIEWPMPTLMRYHLFLQQEEKLKEYDYIFYCDLDMKFVDYIGDEIFGNGLTCAAHPMYYFRKGLHFPLEPNPESSAYIPRTGQYRNLDTKPEFVPFYAAGGFQGGKSDVWIQAMKDIRELIEQDFQINYTAIWNDETYWNKYLYNNPELMKEAILLNPSYVYPDSLIKEYYVPIWGRDYPPKLITITKPFTISKEGGDAVNEVIKTMRHQ